MSYVIQYAIGLLPGLTPLVILGGFLCLLWYGLRDLRRAIWFYRLDDSGKYQESLLKQRLAAGFRHFPAVGARAALRSNWMETFRHIHPQPYHSSIFNNTVQIPDYQKKRVLTGRR